MPGYTLYGADVSYYTGKARAYLDWRGVDYVEELATQQVYRDIILPSVGWPVIPVMKTSAAENLPVTISQSRTGEGFSRTCVPSCLSSAIRRTESTKAAIAVKPLAV